MQDKMDYRAINPAAAQPSGLSRDHRVYSVTTGVWKRKKG
jgi:hypothetical protein